LLSDSSGKVFPNNTIAHFRTKLPQRIYAGHDWKVGLAEIYFPKLNIPLDPEAPSTPEESIVSDEICPLARVQVLEDEVMNLQAKTYDLGELLIEMFKTIPEEKKMDYVTALHNWFQQKLSNSTKPIPLIKRTSLSCPYTFVNIDGNKIPLSATNYTLEELLTTIRKDIGNGDVAARFDIEFQNAYLEINPNRNTTGKRAPKRKLEVPNLPERLTSQVFVYLDVISPQFLGDTMAKCLRVVMVDKGNHQIFIHPYYMSLEKNDFDTIEVKLMNKMGNLYPFTDSINPSSIVLHFIRTSE
jgi:hypothetical protein